MFASAIDSPRAFGDLYSSMLAVVAPSAQLDEYRELRELTGKLLRAHEAIGALLADFDRWIRGQPSAENLDRCALLESITAYEESLRSLRELVLSSSAATRMDRLMRKLVPEQYSGFVSARAKFSAGLDQLIARLAALLDDAQDLMAAEEAIAEHQANGGSVSLDELKRELGL